MKPTHLLLVALAALAAALAPPPAQAGHVKIYTFNGPSRRAAMIPPPPAAAGYPDMTVGKLVWASVNVDGYRTFAVKPDMYTKYYQFNRTKAWAATGYASGMVDVIDESSDWLPDSSPCPTGWRLPTSAEYVALSSAGGEFDDSDGMWAQVNEKGNAVAGRFYGKNCSTCVLPDSMSGCVFFPASGNRYINELHDQGEQGAGWSSTSFSDGDGAHFLLFDSHNSLPFIRINKVVGCSVRCVRDVP